MKQTAKAILKRTPFFEPLKRWARLRRDATEFREWEARGRPAPTPEVVKERSIVACARELGLRVFVETGTFYGEMIDRVRPHFERIYSIELSEELHARAEARFRTDPGVTLIQGDSGVELERVVRQLDQPALFWLDAHWAGPDSAGAGETVPLYNELRHILAAADQRHVVFVDDGHLFGKDPTYPTLQELKDFIASRRTDVEVSVEDDVMKIVPAR